MRADYVTTAFGTRQCRGDARTLIVQSGEVVARARSCKKNQSRRQLLHEGVIAVPRNWLTKKVGLYFRNCSTKIIAVLDKIYVYIYIFPAVLFTTSKNSKIIFFLSLFSL